MKKIISICFLFFVAFYASEGYSHNSGWVASSRCLTPAPPVVQVSPIPEVTYSTFPTPITVSYGWVPYYFCTQTIVERKFLFCKRYVSIPQPSVQWVYQPISVRLP